MISKKMQGAVNQQINKELYSAYLYLAMSVDAELKGFKGAGKWFRIQYQEETGHGMKFMQYLLDQGAAVALEQIAKPPTEFASLLDMFQKTLKHEEGVTKSINALMDLAIAENDHATRILLDWYVTEQVEEEKNDTEVIAMLKMAGTSAGTLLMIDKQLGKRGAAD
jgi:ferritin